MDGFLDKLHTIWAILTARSFLVITDRWDIARIKGIDLDSTLEQLESAQDTVKQFKQNLQLDDMEQGRE
jgi:hypothetical protein|nr:MAG TPA: protein of unknown function (DUF542) [Caudoviricetes sp.]